MVSVRATLLTILGGTVLGAHRRRYPNTLYSSGEVSPSAGCSTGGLGLQKGWQHLAWEQPGLKPVARRYRLFLPDSYDPASASPLMLIFHGWGESAMSYHGHYGFGRLASGRAGKHNFIAVYPQGLNDCKPGADCMSSNKKGYPSWNAVGSSSSSASRMSCDPERQSYNYCYESCARSKEGGCHPCDWATCYDDVGFVGAMLDELTTKLCIDTRRIFAWGCSNGGLMVHELVRGLPGQFAAIASTCGARPHAGWEGELIENGPPASVMLVGGVNDPTMPQHGRPDDGWLYADPEAVTAAYAQYNSCAGTTPRDFPVSGYSARQMQCSEDGYECEGDASVVRCTFVGVHDLNTGLGKDDLMDGPQLAWVFFQAHPLQGRRQHAVADIRP